MSKPIRLSVNTKTIANVQLKSRDRVRFFRKIRNQMQTSNMPRREKKLVQKDAKKKGSIKKRISQQIYSMCMRRSMYNLVCTNVILYIYKQTGSARYVQIRLIRPV